MTSPKNLTLVENNYYHLRANFGGADGQPVDYLFTLSQLEVARTRAEDKPQFVPPPPPPVEVQASAPDVQPAKVSWFQKLFRQGSA